MSAWEDDGDDAGGDDLHAVDLAPRYWVGIRSKRSDTAWETLVAAVTGNHVHTDIILHKDGSESRRFAFSAFMKEPFSMYMVPGGDKESHLFDNLRVALSADEYDACTRYLGVWVDRALPYNYSDTLVGIPSLGNTGPVGDTMFPDVDGSDPRNLRTVFCSQAAVLMLRHCLDRSGPNVGLAEAMDELNSRLTPPAVLYQHMQPYAEEVSNETLFG